MDGRSLSRSRPLFRRYRLMIVPVAFLVVTVVARLRHALLALAVPDDMGVGGLPTNSEVHPQAFRSNEVPGIGLDVLRSSLMHQNRGEGGEPYPGSNSEQFLRLVGMFDSLRRRAQAEPLGGSPSLPPSDGRGGEGGNGKSGLEGIGGEPAGAAAPDAAAAVEPA